MAHHSFTVVGETFTMWQLYRHFTCDSSHIFRSIKLIYKALSNIYEESTRYSHNIHWIHLFVSLGV